MRFHTRHYFGPNNNTYFIILMDEGGSAVKTRRKAPGDVTANHLINSDCMFKLPAHKCAVVDVFKQEVEVEEGSYVTYLYFDVELHGSRLPIPEEESAKPDLGSYADTPIGELAKIPRVEETNGVEPVECSKDCDRGPTSRPCREGFHADCVDDFLVCVRDQG